MLTINKIPVLLLTGYLGSGKTTLLNRILTNTKGIRFAVIVNDIGEVNIDASLIQQGGVVSQNDDSLVALQNGCICCSLKMDLISQLHDLAAQKAYDYIVIEASGICEPAPIAQTLCSYAEMVPQFAQDGLPVLDCICAVVDALRLRDEFDGGDTLAHYVPKEEDLEALVIEQIEFFNLILLNKAAEVTPDELAHIKSIIRAIQPKAEIIETNYCDVDLDKLLNTHLFAPMYITRVNPSTSGSSMSSSRHTGRRMCCGAKECAILPKNTTCVTSLSKPVASSTCARPESGLRPCPKKNSCNSWRMIPSYAKTGTTNMATECRNLSLSVNTSTKPLSKRHSTVACSKTENGRLT